VHNFVNTLAFWVSFPRLVGSPVAPLGPRLSATLPLLCPLTCPAPTCVLAGGARQFSAPSSNSHPPFWLGFCNVYKSILKVASCQMCDAIAVVNCRVYVAEARKICAVYHTVATSEVYISQSLHGHISPIRVFRLCLDFPCHMRPTFVHCLVYRAAECDAEDF